MLLLLLSRLGSVVRVRHFFITVVSNTEKVKMKTKKKKKNLPLATFDKEEEVILLTMYYLY